MRNSHVLPIFIVASATLIGCSTLPEKNSDLEQARSGYVAAQNNPEVTTLAAVQLQTAGKALNSADAAWSERKDPALVAHLAYLAKQRVAIAQETAKLKTAENAVDNAGARRDKVRLEARTVEADMSKQRAESAEMHARQLEQQLNELNAKQTERGMVITLGDVLFDTNKAVLKAGGRQSVQKLADFLSQYPQRTVLIEGYTDSVGSEEYNQRLSERRANSVRDALADMGIGSDRVTARGYGESNPVASNETSGNRHLNRRVEIVLSDEEGKIAPR